VNVGVVLMVIGYLILAGVVARRSFVRSVDRDGRTYAEDDMLWVLIQGMLWPLTLLILAAAWVGRCTIVAPTPRERREQAERLAAERAQEALRVLREYDDGPGKRPPADASWLLP
jgi:hypothetical protein